MSERMFPIQGGPSIPWRIIAPHDQQARHNHDQSLKRLAERGGLDPLEAACILEDRDWPRVGREEVERQRAAAVATLNAINERESAKDRRIAEQSREITRLTSLLKRCPGDADDCKRTPRMFGADSAAEGQRWKCFHCGTTYTTGPGTCPVCRPTQEEPPPGGDS